ncbi:MAG: hypothetical protein Q8Q81_10400 [Oxalobacteraceae bacterium]|nr:hypothetical protein [Oxalobacteraceae bacterium]
MFTGWILDKILTATAFGAYAQRSPVDIPKVIHRQIVENALLDAFSTDLSTFSIFIWLAKAFSSLLVRF